MQYLSDVMVNSKSNLEQVTVLIARRDMCYLGVVEVACSNQVAPTMFSQCGDNEKTEKKRSQFEKRFTPKNPLR